MNPKEGLRAVARNPWVQRGVLITTVLLSSEACIPRPETRPTPPPAPTAPATPKEVPKTLTPQKEKPTTIEQQAMATALDYMLNLLSSSQQSPGSKESLVSTLLNPDFAKSFPRREILEGKQRPPDSDLLRVKWLYSGPLAIGGQNIRRTSGQAEIKNFKLGSAGIVPPVTDADRANGIQWRGAIKIGFINRYRIVKPFWGPGWVREEAPESEWSKVAIPEPTIPFTPWQDGAFTVAFILRNGKWELDTRTVPLPQIIYPVTPFSVGYGSNAFGRFGHGECDPYKPRQQVPGCEIIVFNYTN